MMTILLHHLHFHSFQPGDKVVYTAGAFDLFHILHVTVCCVMVYGISNYYVLYCKMEWVGEHLS